MKEKTKKNNCDLETDSFYQKNGYLPECFNSNWPIIRLRAYFELGFTKEALNDPFSRISLLAKRHFNQCKKILELREVKYEFTKNEAEFLELNNLKINKDSIIKD